MLKYFINLILIFSVATSLAQEQNSDSLQNKPLDSLNYKTAYGLRLGIDLSRFVKPYVAVGYNSGIEFVADYRIFKAFYIALEAGFEDHTTQEDYTTSNAKGNFLRIGFNYNAYKNWLDMNNEIFVGYRYGLSMFDQTLISYTPNVNSIYFPGNLIDDGAVSSLSTHWSELMVGIKVETFSNVFLSASVSFRVLMNTDEPENFKTLYSPGFNRLLESGTGFGLNYTISYLIPFKKK